jgi:hypothetical protein
VALGLAGDDGRRRRVLAAMVACNTLVAFDQTAVVALPAIEEDLGAAPRSCAWPRRARARGVALASAGVVSLALAAQALSALSLLPARACWSPRP